VVAKIRGRTAVNKQGLYIFHIETFNLKELNEVEVSNRFPALEDLDTDVEINTLWKQLERI
jgi:hypothetical protein